MMPKIRAKAVKGLREVLFPTVRNEENLILKLNCLGLGYVHKDERGVSLTSYVDTSSPYGRLRIYSKEELQYLSDIDKLQGRIFTDLDSLLDVWAPILYKFSEKTLEITFKPKGSYARKKRAQWYQRGLRLDSYTAVIEHFNIRFERVLLFGPRCIHVMASCTYREVSLTRVTIAHFSECNYDTILTNLIDKLSSDLQELI